MPHCGMAGQRLAQLLVLILSCAGSASFVDHVMANRALGLDDLVVHPKPNINFRLLHSAIMRRVHQEIGDENHLGM